MKDLFKEHAQKVSVIIAKETIIDDDREEKEYTPIKQLSIEALVSDLIFSQATWKLPGVDLSKAKSLVVEKRNKSILLNSYKFIIDDTEYIGWKQNGKAQIRELDKDYLQLYIYTR